MFVYWGAHLPHSETKAALQEYVQREEAGPVSRAYFKPLALHIEQSIPHSMAQLPTSGNILGHQAWDRSGGVLVGRGRGCY